MGVSPPIRPICQCEEQLKRTRGRRTCLGCSNTKKQDISRIMRAQPKLIVRIHRLGVWTLIRSGHVLGVDGPPHGVSDILMRHPAKRVGKCGELIRVFQPESLEINSSMPVQEAPDAAGCCEVANLGGDL